MQESFYQEYFEIEDRHWWFVGRREVLLRVLDRYYGPEDRPSRRILDVGCGTGTMIGHLAHYGSVEGVDFSEEAVAFCRTRGLDRVQHSDAAPLPFPDGAFDLVTALDVIEHVDDDRALLTELRRVTRPGGALLLSVPAYPFLWGRQDEISHHRRRYLARDLRRRVTSSGWSVRRLTYFNTLLFPAIAAIRLLSRPKRGVALQSDFTMTSPGRLNSLLGRLFALEALLVERVGLPFGVSILALAVNGPTGR